MVGAVGAVGMGWGWGNKQGNVKLCSLKEKKSHKSYVPGHQQPLLLGTKSSFCPSPCKGKLPFL